MPGYLVRQGPYQLIRNPMYAGEAIVWAGWGLVYASPAVWAGLAIMCTGLAATVRWEERRLLRRFGDNYQAYLAEVPRWVPGNASAKGPGVAVFGAIFHGGAVMCVHGGDWLAPLLSRCHGSAILGAAVGPPLVLFAVRKRSSPRK
jgi:hypothetical protein